MAMNLEAVLRIAAKVVGLDEVTALERGLAGAEKAAGQAQGAFKAVVSSASWQAAAAGAAGLAVALGTSAKAAMDFESSMADVRKVVPGLESAEGLKAMKDEILNLSRVLPVSAEGLAEIMAAAGQAGIAREELGQFTKQAAQMGIAFDISAAEAGEAMAKLRTSLGLSQDEVVNLADAMNYLSNNMASSAAEIVDFMKRSGAVGKQVAMTTEQTAAFGSAMIAAGAAPEVAATSFNNLIKAMAKGESVTARQGAAFKRLGLDAVSVAKSMQTDAVGTIRDVFQRISQMPAEMRITTISEIFGDEARALTPLITNLKLFDQAMGLVGDSSNYTGSMLEEFNARAGTSANNWQLLQNNLKALQIVIGEALLPAINLTLKVLTPLISLVSNLAGRFPALTAVIVGLTAAVSAFVIAAPAIVSAITLFGSLKAAIVALNIGGLIAGWLPVFAGLGSAIIGALAPVLAWITGTLIPGLIAVFSGPVGWTVLAIAAVVAMAIAFREPIMQFFSWLGSQIAGGLQALWAWGEPIRAFWVGVWNQAIENARTSLQAIGGVISWAAQAWFAILYQLFVQPWVNLWNVVLKEPVMGALQWISEGIANLGKLLTEALAALIDIAYKVYVKPWVDLWQNVFREPVLNAVNWLSTAWTNISTNFNRYVTEPIQKKWRALMEFIPNAMRKGVDFVRNGWTGMINTIRNAFRGFLVNIANGINSVGNAINKLIRTFNALPGPDIPLIGRIVVPAFATGGFVNRATVGLVGEAGPEYIIPENKMAAASSRYLSGARGAAVLSTGTATVSGSPSGDVTINVKTGPVMEFDGQRYVKLEELDRAMRITAEGVIGRLRTPAARRALGVT